MQFETFGWTLCAALLLCAQYLAMFADNTATILVAFVPLVMGATIAYVMNAGRGRKSAR